MKTKKVVARERRASLRGEKYVSIIGYIPRLLIDSL